MSKIINNKFDIKDEVYLKTDADQKKRIVCAIVVHEESILYRCACGVNVSDHYDFEMSKTVDVEMKILNS